MTSGHPVEQQTRHWNEDDGRTHALRSKEEDYDYRYFPEPDLLPLDPSAEWVEQIRQALPALPRDRRLSLAEAAPARWMTTTLRWSSSARWTDSRWPPSAPEESPSG